MYEAVAELCNSNEAVARSSGLVVGATYTEVLSRLRQKYPECWFLTPGIGAQQGDVERCVREGVRRTDGYGLVVPISRAIAEAENPRAAAQKYSAMINANR